MKVHPRVSVLFPFLALWPALAGEGGDSPASAGTDRAAEATVYYHEERRVGRDISELVQKSPHAYYPSINQLEVALLAPPELRGVAGPSARPTRMWTNWWANGMASMPRELAAARRATTSRSSTLAVQTIWATSR